MDSHIKRIDGDSGNGRITLTPGEFRAVATCTEEFIECNVLRRVSNPRIQWFVRYVPLSIASIIIAMKSMPRILRIPVGILSGALLLHAIANPVYARPYEPGELVVLLVGVLLLCIAMLIRSAVLVRPIAPWHAAEHMAIAAYLETGSTDLETIRAQNRVHPLCGGRFILPDIVVIFAAIALLATLKLNAFLAYLICKECMHWVDELIGYRRIPVFKHASELFQKHVSTKEPDEIHLLTAQAALEELVNAHRMATAGDTHTTVSHS